MLVNTAKSDSQGCALQVLQMKNYPCHWKEKKCEMLQEGHVLAMSVQSTTKTLDRHGDLHRSNKTLGDRKSLAQNHKVAFIVNNSNAHPDVPGLTGTDLFLLPNTTPETQSMNQGVIRLLKAKCCTKVILKYINATDSGKELTNITILNPVITLEQSWSILLDITAANRFKKVGI